MISGGGGRGGPTPNSYIRRFCGLGLSEWTMKVLEGSNVSCSKDKYVPLTLK
jgi:hypothetical protein